MTPEQLEALAAEVTGQKKPVAEKVKKPAFQMPFNALLFCPDCGDVHKHKLVSDDKNVKVVAVQCLKCNKIAKMDKTAVANWLEFRKR
jgi:transcription elongation factor Elf1